MKKRKPELSRRQKEVFSLRVQGLRSKNIARKLGLAVRSVETYWDHAIKKIGSHMGINNPTLTMLIHYGIRYKYAKLHTLASLRALRDELESGDPTRGAGTG